MAKVNSMKTDGYYSNDLFHSNSMFSYHTKTNLDNDGDFLKSQFFSASGTFLGPRKHVSKSQDIRNHTKVIRVNKKQLPVESIRRTFGNASVAPVIFNPNNFMEATERHKKLPTPESSTDLETYSLHNEHLTQSLPRISIEYSYPTVQNFSQTHIPRVQVQHQQTKRKSFGQIHSFHHNKNVKKTQSNSMKFLLLCLLVLTYALIGAIIAVVLLFTIRNSSSQTPLTQVTVTTTSITKPFTTAARAQIYISCLATACSIIVQSVLLSLNGTTPSSWTRYNLSYVAASSSHTLYFGFQSSNNREYYLDDVSVIGTSLPGVELLANGNFENSSSIATGWTQWCTSMCSSRPGRVTNDTSCFGGDYCFYDPCQAMWGMDFLSQTFSTIINQTYTISFMVQKTGFGVSSSDSFYTFIL